MGAAKGLLRLTERSPYRNKTSFCGIDLHSNNAMYVITDQEDKQLFKRRSPNRLPVVLESLEPSWKQLEVVAVESTYNWCWLVDGFLDPDYPVLLANPAAIDQYNGIKEADDLTEAAFLARHGHGITGFRVLPATGALSGEYVQ